jgi:hypothetical protein
MASARKTYTRGKPAHLGAPPGEQVDKTCFVNDLLDGTIKATTVETVRAGNGLYLRLEYVEPTPQQDRLVEEPPGRGRP